MKKRIKYLFLAIVSALTLASCGKENLPKPITTSDEVVDDHDRGSEDLSLPNVDLPDVIFDKPEDNGNNNNQNQEIEETNIFANKKLVVSTVKFSGT